MVHADALGAEELRRHRHRRREDETRAEADRRGAERQHAAAVSPPGEKEESGGHRDQPRRQPPCSRDPIPSSCHNRRHITARAACCNIGWRPAGELTSEEVGKRGEEAAVEGTGRVDTHQRRRPLLAPPQALTDLPKIVAVDQPHRAPAKVGEVVDPKVHPAHQPPGPVLLSHHGHPIPPQPPSSSKAAAAAVGKPVPPSRGSLYFGREQLAEDLQVLGTVPGAPTPTPDAEERKEEKGAAGEEEAGCGSGAGGGEDEEVNSHEDGEPKEEEEDTVLRFVLVATVVVCSGHRG